MNCRCGHAARLHARRGSGRCETWSVEAELDADGFMVGPTCPCEEFDDSRLPAAGERLEFGVHHMGRRDAEAEAWPVGERRIETRLRRAAGLRD